MSGLTSLLRAANTGGSREKEGAKVKEWSRSTVFAYFRPFQLTVGWRNREENGRNKRKRGKPGVMDAMWSRNERETQMEWSAA